MNNNTVVSNHAPFGPTEQIATEQIALAETVRQACLEAVLTAYENARIDGLCHEGAWECAVDAMRRLDVAAALRQPNGRP